MQIIVWAKFFLFHVMPSIHTGLMRIIGGTAAGLILKTPKGYGVRPTPDLVRQAVFNSLGARVVGARVLDLFSGTGALGLECVSRGGAAVVFVEKAQRHAEYIRLNAAAAEFPKEKFEVRTQEVFTVLSQLTSVSRRFDLVLADPPYGEKNLNRRSTSFAQRLLDDLNLPQLIEPGGLFVLGHTKRDTLSVPQVWGELKVLKHGDSWMRFLQKAVVNP